MVLAPDEMVLYGMSHKRCRYHRIYTTTIRTVSALKFRFGLVGEWLTRNFWAYTALPRLLVEIQLLRMSWTVPVDPSIFCCERIAAGGELSEEMGAKDDRDVVLAGETWVRHG